MAKTAGILIIGNEVLSGKVTDQNSPYLVRELRAWEWGPTDHDHSG
jgi:molybdopterin-biosynthesis enzyme MoeA-like protein